MTLRSGAKHGAALIGGLGLTWYFGWSTSDLIWSFWFTSLVTGFTMALVSFGAPLLRPDAHPVERGLSLGGGLLGLGFFTIHFGLFHYVHSGFLDLFFPLLPQPDRVYVGTLTWKGATSASLPEILSITASSYWLFAVISILHDAKVVFTPIDVLGSYQAYRSVIKLHILIFLLAGAHAVGLDSFPVYILVLSIFYYSPDWLWRRMMELKKTGGPTTPAPGS